MNRIATLNNRKNTIIDLIKDNPKWDIDMAGIRNRGYVLAVNKEDKSEFTYIYSPDKVYFVFGMGDSEYSYDSTNPKGYEFEENSISPWDQQIYFHHITSNEFYRQLSRFIDILSY